MLAVPFQILSGGNRITLLGQVEAPAQAPGAWPFKIGGGTVVLNSPGEQGEPLILNRIAVNGQFDPVKKRFVVDHGDIGNADVGVACLGQRGLFQRRPASRRRRRRDAHVGRCT